MIDVREIERESIISTHNRPSRKNGREEEAETRADQINNTLNRSS